MLTTYRDKVGGKVIRTTSKPDKDVLSIAVDLAIRSRFDTLFEVKPNGEVKDCTDALNKKKLENLKLVEL